MAEFNEENKVEGAFGGVAFNNGNEVNAQELPTKPSVWTKIRSFLFQEIDWYSPITVELTPYQQKVENEINEFLHQEVSFKGFFNLFKKNKE